MKGRVDKFKFFIFISIASFLLLNFIKPFCQEKKNVNFEEFSPDFQKAYNFFENASLTDTGEYTYKNAINEFKSVIGKTKNVKEKTACYFFISFAYFLDGEEEEALKNAKECFNQCQDLFKEENTFLILKDLISKIEKGDIKNTSDIMSVSQIAPETKEFIEELIQLHERKEEIEEMKKKCWTKYKSKFEEELRLLNNKYKTEKFEEVKKQLEEKYRKKGWFTEEELKEDFMKIFMENIF